MIPLTLRDLLMVHAPAPQDWFTPKMTFEAPVWPGMRPNPETEEYREKRNKYDHDAAMYSAEYKKQQAIQWPSVWADAVIEADQA